MTLRTRGFKRIAVSSLVSLLLSGVAIELQPQPMAAQTVIGCDRVVNLGNNWRRQQSVVNVNTVLCYQVPGAAIVNELQRLRAPLLIELQVSSGSFDVYLFPVVGGNASSGSAIKLNPGPLGPNAAWQTLPFSAITESNYVVAIAPSMPGQRGSYRFRLRVASPPVTVPIIVPPPEPGTATVVLPTTTNRPCSTAGVGLSNFCVDPYPISRGGTAFAIWRIPNFVRGDFDRGDGQGFRGPIAQEQRVDVPNVFDPRVIRLRWTDTFGREFIDSLVVAVSQQPPALTATPIPPGDVFPCSRSGIGVTNLCIEQPYPVRRGTSAFAVWRIASFRSGEFDAGDSRGFVGPILREQRVEIPNVTGLRTIQLRWVDESGVTRVDSFTIQIVN